MCRVSLLAVMYYPDLVPCGYEDELADCLTVGWLAGPKRLSRGICYAMRKLITKQAYAPNPAMTSLFQIDCHRRRVGDTFRSLTV